MKTAVLGVVFILIQACAYDSYKEGILLICFIIESER
jgi:hypothetical protein